MFSKNFCEERLFAKCPKCNQSVRGRVTPILFPTVGMSSCAEFNSVVHFRCKMEQRDLVVHIKCANTLVAAVLLSAVHV